MNSIHAQYLRKALSLAQPYQGQVAPNPPVGAILVKDGAICGTGAHLGPGHPHAEVMAIQSMHADISHATLYVTLEPCCHLGKTPPCTELIIKSRIHTVYYGFVDPNPIIAGRGIQILEAHGIRCMLYHLPDIDQFYRAYQYWHQHQRPWVTAKLAISLDGKIANPDSQPVYLTGKKTQKYTHQRRRKQDALLTTSRTVIQDNPKLSVRDRWPIQKKPIYILDPELRFPIDATLWETTKSMTLLHLLDIIDLKARKQRLNEISRQKNTPLRCIPITREHPSSTRLSLNDVLTHIGQDGIQRLWVEAGGVCFESFLHQQLLNEAFIYIAPCMLGEAALSAFRKHYVFENSMITYDICEPDIIMHITWHS